MAHEIRDSTPGGSKWVHELPFGNYGRHLCRPTNGCREAFVGDQEAGSDDIKQLVGVSNLKRINYMEVITFDSEPMANRVVSVTLVPSALALP
jgi:hypothetical protein